MRRLFLILGLLVGISQAQTTTTITGTIKDLSQALVTSGKVTFTLQPSRDTTISGLARFSPAQVVCLINASGLIKAQDGTSVCTLTMNTALNPPGTYYRVDVWPFNVKTSSFTFYAVLSTYDWSTVVPTPTTSPAQNFVDIFSNQTIGGNKTFSGQVTFSGGLTSLAFTNAGVFTNTQMNEYVTSSINGLNFQTEFQAGQGNQNSTDAAAFGVVMPFGATVLQTNGVAGYVLNQSNGGAGVAVYGQGRCNSTVNGARCWGGNLVATDLLGTSALNLHSSTLTGLEIDTDPANASDGTIGVEALLNSSVFVLNSVSYTGGTAFLAGGNYRANNILWSTGFGTQDAGAVSYGSAGATCLSGTCPSQQLNFYYFNAGVENNLNIRSDASGDFQVNMPAGGTLTLGAGTGATFKEGAAVAAAPNTDICYGDSTAHAIECSYNNDAFKPETRTIASGTATMTTAAIGAGACGTTVTVAASGALTTDSVNHAFNSSVAANPGQLTFNKWPTANNVNFNYCNPTAGSITPSAATVNWTVTR